MMDVGKIAGEGEGNVDDADGEKWTRNNNGQKTSYAGLDITGSSLAFISFNSIHSTI